MNKKTIFFLLTCLLLVASTTYIICATYVSMRGAGILRNE